MYIEIYYIVIINVIVFVLGYIIGSKQIINNTTSNSIIGNKSLKNTSKSSNINIDETKVITKIDTEGLEKKYSQLGDRTVSDSDISSSVDKLKKLKK